MLVVSTRSETEYISGVRDGPDTALPQPRLSRPRAWWRRCRQSRMALPPTRRLRNGVVMPTIAAGTGGYDNQQGKVLRNGLVMPTMSAGTWQYDDGEAEAEAKLSRAALTAGSATSTRRMITATRRA